MDVDWLIRELRTEDDLDRRFNNTRSVMHEAASALEHLQRELAERDRQIAALRNPARCECGHSQSVHNTRAPCRMEDCGCRDFTPIEAEGKTI